MNRSLLDEINVQHIHQRVFIVDYCSWRNAGIKEYKEAWFAMMLYHNPLNFIVKALFAVRSLENLVSSTVPKFLSSHLS